MTSSAQAILPLEFPFSFYFIIKHHFASILFIITMLGERLLGEELKYLLSRSRPDGPHLVEIDGHSFPSHML
ncbi:hypothetical protein [Priestia endophytica]|uniref:hypothetical protein n=1 Tax=Priestia endophytica TaxID=135735 RepID=UPI002E24F27E|nr:hypothetical protein [Priestia endophytica]